MASRRVAKKGFLADYSVEDPYLLKPDRVVGRAGIFQARDPQSRNVLVKYWPVARGISTAVDRTPMPFKARVGTDRTSISAV
jgi:hypothetical protein